MNWLTYANQGATRNQPLSDDLVEALSFMPEMGLALKVFSGGQPAKGSGKPRVGSTRHDHGHAADAFLYRDGERLDWANPDQQPIFQEFVRRARANGVTGIGAGDGYMQPGSMHIGFGNDAVWGAGGKGANAPSWLREAAGQAPARQIADGAMRAIGKDPIRQTSTAIGGQGADTMQQSTGLLGQLARPEDKVGGLLGMMFKNMTPDRADQIRAGLAGLQGIENQGVYNAATQRMGDRKAQRREDTALARQQAEQQQAEAQAAQQREAAARFSLEHGNERLARAAMDGLVPTGKIYELINKPEEFEVRQIKMPDGSEVMVERPKGSNDPWKPSQLPEGGTTGSGGSTKLTEGQSKLTLFQTLQDETQPVLLSLEGQFDPANMSDPAKARIPIAGNYFKSPEYQMYETAAAAWAEGALRIATGAAATQPEIERNIKTYFAQPGDTPQTVAFKAQMREMYSRAVNNALGKPSDGETLPIPRPEDFAAQVGGSGVADAPAIDSDAIPKGITPKEWEFMPPEDRALFR